MGLSLNNICIGNVSIELNSCNSTNIFAKNLMAKSEPIEGTVIITDKQTNGKGQIGNTWQSEEGKNLTFSIILKPTFLKIEDQFMLSKIVSLACVETFEYFTSKKFKIKWPNDIYIENNKIGGILIENMLSNGKIATSILGVGLNINQEHFLNLPRAVSLKNVKYHNYNLISVLEVLLKKIDVYYLILRKGKFDEINNLYIDKMLGFEQERIFNEKGNLFKAIVKGVNKQGQLILELENGYQQVFSFKEISWHF